MAATAHGIRKDVDTFEHALARVIAESNFFRCHGRVLLVNLFGIYDGHDIFFTHDHELGPFKLHFGTAVFAEQNPVADLDIALTHLPVVENPALADGDDLALNGFSAAVSGMTMPPGEVRSSGQAFHKDAVV